MQTHTVTVGGVATQYTYTYDDNGNITSVTDGTNTVTYTYDSANQLIREEMTGVYRRSWTYDNAGNILSRTEETWTNDAWGNATTYTYTYGDDSWGDLLTAYNGQAITYDEMGNPLSDGTWTYTWQHGRELASMTDGSTTWTFTYDANGMRTQRARAGRTDKYVYNGSLLMQMKRGTANTLDFIYDAAGRPTAVSLNGTLYYYITNLQGDITAIVDTAGATVVQYSYDAWGNILSTTGTLASTLGQYNPLRYRGYVYDQETGLYYLQSRYYDPKIGRFINGDSQLNIGEGVLGCNMYTYCLNNPVNGYDPCGTCFHRWDFWNNCEDCEKKWNDAAAKVYKTCEAIYKSVDAYAGIGLGLYGGGKVTKILEISGGISYDLIGVRLDNGEVTVSQRYYSGVELSLVAAVASFSEEMYREYTFSGPLPQWEEDASASDPVFGVGAYLGLGGTINIAIDFKSLFSELNKIFSEN